MTRVSTKFGITAPVPFVDVHVERDNRLFLEPSAIRAAAAASSPRAIRARRHLVSFFDEVLTTVRSGNRYQGIRLLSELHEPNETRLGMTLFGVAGHGVGDQLAADLWQAMRSNAACLNAVAVSHIEDLALFVERVGPDLVSDLCTRILFGELASFTDEMMFLYPSLVAGATTRTETIWSPVTRSWVKRDITLPVAAGKRLLLVPTDWVWSRLLMNASSFYQVEALGEIQANSIRPGRFRGDKPFKPTKDDLRREYPEIKPTNVSQTILAAGDGVSLTDRHRSYVDDRFEGIKLDPVGINNLL